MRMNGPSCRMTADFGEPATIAGERVEVELDDGGPIGPSSSIAETVAGVVIEVIEAESDRSGLVELSFVDRATITEMNEQHLGGVGATDVLSFPLDAEDITDDPFAGLDTGGPVIGSILICDEVVVAQATGHVGDVMGERLLMGIHAALHLLGHDHVSDDERVEMQAIERRHLERHGVAHPGDQAP